MSEDDGEITTRRARRRAIRGSGLSDSSVSEGGNISDGLNEEVERMADAPRAPAPLTEIENTGSRTDAPPDFTPYNRMSDVRTRASKYEREYRLKLVHRMLMRNVPLDQIAQELSVSVDTVMRDRKELFNRLKEEAKSLDINKLVGDSMGFYNEVKGMALRSASATKLPMNLRLAAMRTALAANNDMHRFLSHVGVYDVLKYRTGEGESSSDIDKLMQITDAVIKSAEDPLQSIAKLPLLEDDEDIHLT